MKQSILCKWFGLHVYEVFKENDLVDKKENVIGKVITSRCTICGKIKTDNIYIEEGHGRF